MDHITKYELEWMDKIHRTNIQTRILRFITDIADNCVIWYIVAALFFLNKNTRFITREYFIALGIFVVIAQLIMKPLIGRERPFVYNKKPYMTRKMPKDKSFPSGHSGWSFCMVGVVLMANSYWVVPVLVLAILIAYSRIYLNVHYPSDVVVGSVMGLIIGILIPLIV